MIAWFKQLLRNWLLRVKWHDRSEPTPSDEKIWATDGASVWEIWGSGKPIEKGAIKVKYWARRFAPDPPPPAEARVWLGHKKAVQKETP